MHAVVYTLIAALLATPIAAADYYEGKPDCPPDEFCTTSVEDGPDAPVSNEDPDCVDEEGPCRRVPGDAQDGAPEPGSQQEGAARPESASQEAPAAGLLVALVVFALALGRRR